MIVKELVARLGLDIDEAAFSKADALIVGLSKGFIAFGSAALAGVAIGLAAITKSSAEAADQIQRLSQSTGVDSIALQEFGYSAQFAHVGLQDLATGMQHLAKKGVRDVRAEIFRLSDRMKAMPNDGARVALAIEKFGRTGAKLIPWLSGGAESLRQLAQEAHELGVVFDVDAQKASEGFNDNLDRLQYGLIGVRNAIGMALMPTLNRLVLGMLSFLKLMRTNWTPIVDRVTLGIKTLAFIMAGALLAALVANGAAIAVNVGWYAALSVAAVRAGVSAALAWAAAAAPVVLLAAYFTALLLILEDIYVWLKGGDSLIGEMLPKWNNFVAALTQHNASEPYWLFWLREAVQLIDRMTVLPRVLAMWGALKLQSDDSGQVKNFQAPAGMFGGGASPAHSAAVSNHQTTHSRRQVNITNNVTNNVNTTPGMNPQDVANKVTEQMDAHFDAQIRKAAAGVQ